MEKTLRLMRRLEKNEQLRKILMIMKLTIFLFFLAISQMMAVESYAQSTRLSLNLKSVAVKNVLDEIEENSEFVFLYNSKLINVDQIVSMDINNQKISEILDNLFQEADVAYTVVDRQIVLTQKADQASFLELNNVQQGSTVKGKVTDSSGDPLPGVSVVLKGTAIGCITDAYGNYSLTSTPTNATLQFSFVGLKTQEVNIGTQTTINVVLIEELIGLNEVIAVGYGTSKRRDVVGSIAKLSSEMITKNPVTSVTQSLQGLASGVFVSNTSGHPGTGPEILIRGRSSINLSSGPLWIIDGIPVFTGSSQLTTQGVRPVSALSMINPNDIESIEVLKDAAATSIYGNRASGGVILVTTKSNKGGLTGVTVNYDGGMSQLPFQQSDIYVDTKTWWELTDQAWANSGNTTITQPNTLTNVMFIGEKPNLTREEAEAINTDNLKALTQNSHFHQFGLAANKGFESGGVMFSLNYRDEKGLLRNNNLQRLTSRFSLDFDPLKSLHFGISSNFLYLKNSGVASREGKEGGGWGNWMVMLPWYQLYDPNSQTGYWMASSAYNPLASSDPKLIRDDSDQYQAISSASVKWDTPVKGLSVKGEAGVNLLITNSSHWRSILLDPLAPFQNEAAERSVTQYTFNYTGYLNYDKKIGSHNFNITAGSEATRSASYNRQVDAAQILSSYPELINPLKINSANGSFGDGGYLMGLFGRANYKFKDRYILNASIRRDGHSALSKEHRWATFTAVGAAWVISDEKFFNFNAINLLKLRGSYGQTGNTALNKAMTQINWGLTNTRYGGSYLPGGTTIGPIGSTDLKWETTSGTDFGFDFGIFKNKISGSVAYYTKSISDLILQGNVQESVGFNVNSVWENIGDMKSWGWEFNVSTININKGDFNWKTDFNISFNDNRIVSLNEFEKGKGTEVSSVVSGRGNSTIRKEGEKLDTWYISNFVEIDPERGIALIEQRDQTIWDTEFKTVSTGSLIPMNDANVNANKMIQHGKSALPTFYGGFANNIGYKNFDLNVQFVFAGGNYIINYLYSRSGNASSQGQIAKDIVGKTWEEPGDIAEFPRLVTEYTHKYDNAGNPSATGTRFQSDFSTFYLEKGDYIKLSNLQLSYTLPKAISQRVQLQNVRLYIGGSNLLTLTKFRGFDPESNDDLPIPRSVNFGCSLSF